MFDFLYDLHINTLLNEYLQFLNDAEKIFDMRKEINLQLLLTDIRQSGYLINLSDAIISLV